jgi:hypothetical protein
MLCSRHLRTSQKFPNLKGLTSLILPFALHVFASMCKNHEQNAEWEIAINLCKQRPPASHALTQRAVDMPIHMPTSLSLDKPSSTARSLVSRALILRYLECLGQTTVFWL